MFYGVAGGIKMVENKKIIVDGIEYIPKGSEANTKAPLKKGMEYCIVRTYSAGVFAGYIDRKIKGQENTVCEARRLWYWDGAASLSQLANEGVKKPTNCKFAQEVPEVDLKNIIEVIPCTSKAQEIIKGVKIWEQ